MKRNEGFKLEDLISPIAGELELVEEGLLSEADLTLGSIRTMNQYVHNSGGKRIRPALLLFISRILGGKRESALKLAIVIEYIHAATLVHDDVIDGAEMRRGRESLNAFLRNKEVVLFGDWLYMTAFAGALDLADFRILQTLIRVTRQMVEGELLQMEAAFNPDVTEDVRERITFCKTAGLFSCSCRLGAQAAGAEPRVEEGFSRFGEALGMSFQLVDDLLDYTSCEKDLGKPVLKDLEEGNVTLPIIYLLGEASPPDRRFVREVISGGKPGPESKTRILKLVRRYGCLERTAARAEAYAVQAREALEMIPLEEDSRNLLQALPGWILSRSC